MFDIESRAIYNALIAKGSRTAPTYAEVRREALDALNSRLNPLFGVRF